MVFTTEYDINLFNKFLTQKDFYNLTKTTIQLFRIITK